MPIEWTSMPRLSAPPPIQIRYPRKERSLPVFPKERFVPSSENHALDADHDGAEVKITMVSKPVNEMTWHRLEVLITIKHPNIQPMTGIYDADTSICIVQNVRSSGLTSSCPLLQEIMHLGGYTETQLHDRAYALLNALHQLHSKSIAHGNLTFDSIYIHRGQLVLHVPPKPDHHIEFPATAANKANDIFAFGILLYMLATGRHPFATTESTSSSQVLCNMDHPSFQVDIVALQHLAPSAQSVILDCLARPESRRPTTEELLKRDWFRVRLTMTSTFANPLNRTTAETTESYVSIPGRSSSRGVRKRLSGSTTFVPAATGATPSSPDEDSMSDPVYHQFSNYSAPPPPPYASFNYPSNESFSKDLAASLLVAPSPATMSLLPSERTHKSRSVFRHVKSEPDLPSMSNRPVVFSAYGPLTIPADNKCRVFIWAYLAHQIDEIRELAAAQNTIETGRLSKSLYVSIGKVITISLEPPKGWRLVGEQAKSFHWIEDIERVFFDIAVDENASEWSFLCRARIVVGTHVALLHFALPAIDHNNAKLEKDQVQYSSTYERLAPVESPMIAREDLTILEPVGSGFFGTAYRAIHRPTNKEVVVKTLRQDIDISRDEFEHEVKALTMIGNHPHVVDFIGACDDGNSLSLVMEYVPNGSLQSLLYQSNNYETYMRTIFARDAAHGILNIHQGHFLHRDIAARNCLVDADYHVKVCDFGLSRPVDRVMGHLLDPISAGPLKWMAPESLELPHVFSTASDTYMFGVLLFEIMMGKEPFLSLPPHEAAALVLEGHRLTLKEWNECPPTHQELLDQCFKLDPHDRPTMAHVAATLDDWLTQQA
ncbi:hypothetical protein LEN26_000352 [Aphanomyces euteiches]|nr:hypothetical protein LEN26_000352 [Aphanomyces euteiches]